MLIVPVFGKKEEPDHCASVLAVIQLINKVDNLEDGEYVSYGDEDEESLRT